MRKRHQPCQSESTKKRDFNLIFLAKGILMDKSTSARCFCLLSQL